ncbi:MAG: hypothetical protein R2878_10825 [Thermoleophilia bacterium]
MTGDGIRGISGLYGEPIRPPGAAEANRLAEAERRRQIAERERSDDGAQDDTTRQAPAADGRGHYGGAPDPTGNTGSSLDAFA